MLKWILTPSWITQYLRDCDNRYSNDLHYIDTRLINEACLKFANICVQSNKNYLRMSKWCVSFFFAGYTMTTPYWSDFVPNSTFYRILSGFHRTLATGVACRQGTLTPPDTWSRPFGTCICSTCWEQSFSELVVILPDYALRISLGTFSILIGIRARRNIFCEGGLLF